MTEAFFSQQAAASGAKEEEGRRDFVERDKVVRGAVAPRRRFCEAELQDLAPRALSLRFARDSRRCRSARAVVGSSCYNILQADTDRE